MAKSVDVYIGEKLKEFREKHSISQDTLADAIGYSQQSVARFELNKVSTPLHLAKTIMNEFNEPEILKAWLDKVFEIAMEGVIPSDIIQNSYYELTYR